ncbi:MAG: hypothetical protein ACI9VT_003469 [Psychroserpens sp.]|jgi:hypothetical protein
MGSLISKNRHNLNYVEALSSGYIIASGLIEEACHHIINHRLYITGA